jgi:uncharacterized protein (DUF924 family)
MLTAEDILTFWFTECTFEDWFGGKAEFDARLSARFTQTHRHVAHGEAYGWRTSAQGRLAEIIVLDQFSRQLHRNSPKAFAQDGMALVLTQELVAQKLDATLTSHQRMFAYMPYTHSESLLIHEEAVRLFSALDVPEAIKSELEHRAVLERFGRYPKRNAALGRISTPEELFYLHDNREGAI